MPRPAPLARCPALQKSARKSGGLSRELASLQDNEQAAASTQDTLQRIKARLKSRTNMRRQVGEEREGRAGGEGGAG